MANNLVLFPGGSAYARKIKSLFGSSVVAFWPQNESGGTVSRDIGGRGLNGAYTGVTLRAQGIGDGETAASFDGTTSYNNIYSAGLASSFNSQEGTLLAWAKIPLSSWGDGTNRMIATIRTDVNNEIYISKSNVANTVFLRYNAGGAPKNLASSTLGAVTAYFALCITWSVSRDNVKFWGVGSQLSATQTGLGTWSGALASTTCVIGAISTTPGFPFFGSIGPVLLLNRAATAGEIAAASTL